MRYMHSLNFITQKPGWFKNLLLCAVCLIIPVIGPIVLLGYMFEVFDALRRDPDKTAYPEFDFSRFTAYLSRGIWPFLVQMIMQVVAMVPVGIFYAIVIGVSVAGSQSGGKGGAIIAVVWLLYFVVIFVVSILIAVVAWPMMTYAGVAQKFDLSGMIGYSKDFVRKTLKELVITLVFLMAAGTVMGMLGFLACCVGIYLVAPAMTLAQHHLKVQLYELYLQRGGIAIPEPTPKVIRPVADWREPRDPPEPGGPSSDAIRPGPG
jgi:hypothetical protein